MSSTSIIGAVALMYSRLPTSFLPGEDQGTMLVNVQLPPGATVERTRNVMEQVEGWVLKQPEVQSMVSVLGFSFSGQGQNAALAFITLKPWDERPRPDQSADALLRLVEVMDNLDGTLSIFGTVLDQASPATAPAAGNASSFSSANRATMNARAFSFSGVWAPSLRTKE